MNIQQRVEGDRTVFQISGAQTPRDAGTLRAVVDQALHRGARNVVLDLERVRDLGASGLGELVGIHGAVRRAGGQLALAAVPGRIRYLLAATGLEAVFDEVDAPDRPAAGARIRVA